MSLEGERDDSNFKESRSLQQVGSEQPQQQQPCVSRLSNPYSVKRSLSTPPAIPIFPFSSEKSTGTIEIHSSHAFPKEPHNSSDVSSETAHVDKAVDKEYPATTAIIERSSDASHGVDPKPRSDVSFSTFDPRWKRLPSQTVTFGSAEILTVTELLQHARHFCNRSVRITGILQRRHVHANHHRVHDETTPAHGAELHRPPRLESHNILVTMVLTDPLVANTKKKKPRSSLLPARRISFGKSPVAAASLALPKSSITRMGEAETRTPADKLQSGINSLVFKTPGKSNPSSLHKSTPYFTPRYVGVKRPLSVSNRTTGVDAIVEDLAEQIGVWIVVNPEHVPINDCAVGDLVMVMGEVRTLDDDPMIEPDHEIRYMYHELAKQQVEGNAFHVRARIVKNVNGTNMQLQHEALLLRRRSTRESWACTGAGDDDLLFRPGCGPPDPVDPVPNNSKDNG